jgi:hypothetical protein
MTNENTATEVDPATAQSASRPTHVLSRFHGSAGPPTSLPAIAAAGSPNAIMAHTAATSGMSVSPKTRMSSRTIAGYATIPVSRRGTAFR